MHRLSNVKFPNILQLRHITYIRGIRSIGKQQGRGSQTQHHAMNEEKLIVEVEKNDILYDPKHHYYKDTGRKDNVWTDISQIMGVDGEFTTLFAHFITCFVLVW